MYIKGDSLGDTNMRYRHCLVLINNEVVKIRDIRSITSTKVVFDGYTWKNFGFTKRETFDIALKDINWSKVAPQYVNFIPSKGCGLIRRASRSRTYSLGTRDDNTDVLHAGVQTQPRIDVLPYALTRIGKEFPSKDKAFRQITEGLSTARAISKRVALVQVNDKIVAYIMASPVGTLQDANTVEVSFKHKYFKEELEELGFTVNLREV